MSYPDLRCRDPRTQGRTENFYHQALERYKDFTYKEFHKYIARKMAAFYERHGFPKTKTDKLKTAPDESQELEVGDIVTVDGEAAVNKSWALSGSEEDEEEQGSGAESGGAAAAEAGAPAAAAAAPDAAAAAEGAAPA
jgi:hypothetical protein